MGCSAVSDATAGRRTGFPHGAFKRKVLTNIQQGHAPDDVYDETRREFGEKELVRLTLAVTQINAWNRIAIGFRSEPGRYQPRKTVQA